MAVMTLNCVLVHMYGSYRHKIWGERQKVKSSDQAKRNEMVCRNGFTQGQLQERRCFPRMMSPPRVNFFGWTHQVH
jgi:hypothetical protein